MTTIMILGSNSPSGANFCAHGLDLGADVVAISRSPEKHPIFLPYKWKNRKSLIFEQLDFNYDMERLESLIRRHRPKYIVNYASQGMVAQSWENPADWMQTNVVANVNLLELLRKIDFLERYVHFTTPEVYGWTRDWVGENRSYAPSSPYALSRAAGDMQVALWEKTYGLPVVMTRSATVYGEGQQLYRIIPRAFMCCLTGTKLQLEGAGQSERSYIHFDDISRAIMLVCKKGENGEDYHISPHHSIKISELVKTICNILEVDFDEIVENTEDRLGKDHAYLLDSTKIELELGWEQQINLDEGLARCAAWFRHNLTTLIDLPKKYSHKK